MSEVLIPKETEPSRIEKCRSSVLAWAASLNEKERMHLDLPNDFVRIFFKNTESIPQDLWDHLESELGSFTNKEGWLAVINEFVPLDTWDEKIRTKSPDGKVIDVHIKYTEEGNRVAGIFLKGVGEVED